MGTLAACLKQVFSDWPRKLFTDACSQENILTHNYNSCMYACVAGEARWRLLPAHQLTWPVQQLSQSMQHYQTLG